MFKYSSTHLLNDVNDENLWLNEADGAGQADKSLVVDHDDKFYASAIKAVRKSEPVEAACEEIKFDMPEFSADKVNARLYLYVRTHDQANPLYANDWIYKGKPFQIEFKGSTTPADAAKSLADNSAKWINFVFGKKVLEISNDGATVSIKVANKDCDLYFYKVEVQEFVPASSANDYAYAFYADGGFDTIAGWSLNPEANENYEEALEVEYVTKGNGGFGTGMYLLKNLRLPTNANMLFMSVNSVAGEMPDLTAMYTQYIITQCTDRPEVQGTSVIGQYNRSVTNHILWVKSDKASAFEEKLTTLIADSKDFNGDAVTIKIYTPGDQTEALGNA